MMRTAMFENTRSLKYVCDKLHLLVTQHLSGTDIINMLELEARLYRLLLGCDACMSRIFVKIDFVDAPDPNDVKFILRTKRKYTKFRFLCYDSIESSNYSLKILDLFAENMETIEIYDMVIESDLEDNIKNLSSLRHFKVSSFKGNYQNIFLQLGKRYESMTFENLLLPVDLKAISEFNTASKVLNMKNCTYKNLDSFSYFDGYCTSFIFEFNKRSDWSELCAILYKSFGLKELLITKKTSAGYRLKIDREVVHSTASINAIILSKRKSEAQELKELKESQELKAQESKAQELKEQKLKAEELKELRDLASTRREAFVEMKASIELETIKETYAAFFMKRRSVSKITSDDSDDASSISSKMSVNSESPNLPKESYKASIEIDDITLPFIRKLSKALPFLTTLRVFDVHLSIVSQIFKSFNWLQKVVVVKDDFETELSRSMFEFEFSLNPISKIPTETLDLVFQHFDMEELLNVSTIAKSWNESLGESEVFKKRTILKVKSSCFRKKDDKFCKASQRNYKHVDVSCQNSNEFSIAGLELVHVFSSYVVELTLVDLHLEKISSLKDRFIFTQLKKLNLRNVDVNSCSVLLQNCEILHSLSLSSMPLTQSIMQRLHCNKNFKKLSLTDCTFEFFAKYKFEKTRYEEKFEPIEMNLMSFGLWFDRANCWKIQETIGFKNFAKVFSMRSVEMLQVSGVRGEFLMNFLKQMKSIEKLTIKHIWEIDLKTKNFYEIRKYFELELLTFGIGYSINWIKAFPTNSQFSIKRQKFMDISKNDERFRKALKYSATKMIDMGLFVPEKIPIGYSDPILRVSEKVQDLMFQHLSGNDILNAFEVSRTWNNFLKASDHCAGKYILHLHESYDRGDRTVLENSSRKFMNIITEYYQPTMVKSFSNVRRLSIVFFVTEKFIVADAFPQLETLIIRKCPSKLYKAKTVLKCFEVFAKTTTLTFLEIYEAVTCENYEAIWDMLSNNVKLKKLKIHQCSEFYHLFCEDISHRIRFQLDHLDYRIPQKFSLVGSQFEQNCAKFIRTQNSVKIIDMNLCSAVMLNEIFRLPNIETLRLLRITDYDHVSLKPCMTLKEFVFPDTPQTYVLNSHQHFDFIPFFEAVPNVEHFYVYSLTKEMLEYAAWHLKKLKILTCDRFTGNDIYKVYNALRYIRANDVNRTIKIMETKFNLLDTDVRTFARIFGEEK